jgi:uncharacterized protein
LDLIMISVADLVLTNRIPGNYYAKDTYVRGDLEMGLLENQRGDRLLALPHALIQGIYSGIEKETGDAGRLVLYNCGRWWGKHFFRRFRDELTDYYQQALVDMKMPVFLQALRNCWATYGWGKLTFDLSHQAQGFIIIQTRNSSFARNSSGDGTRPMCALEAGVLASFFGELAGRELDCCQVSCESMGADCNRFMIGLPDRLVATDALIEQQLPYQEIIDRLCQLAAAN